VPESKRFRASDGHALVDVGVGTSEQFDMIPEQIRVIQHERVKYACPCCDLGIEVAPVQPPIIARGLFTESALAWAITGKYRHADLPPGGSATPLRWRHLVQHSRGKRRACRARNPARDQIDARCKTRCLDDLRRLIDLPVTQGSGASAANQSYVRAQMDGCGPTFRFVHRHAWSWWCETRSVALCRRQIAHCIDD